MISEISVKNFIKTQETLLSRKPPYKSFSESCNMFSYSFIHTNTANKETIWKNWYVHFDIQTVVRSILLPEILD